MLHEHNSASDFIARVARLSKGEESEDFYNLRFKVSRGAKASALSPQGVMFHRFIPNAALREDQWRLEKAYIKNLLEGLAAQGEQINAIVVVEGADPSGFRKRLEQLQEVKREWPDISTLVVNSGLMPKYNRFLRGEVLPEELPNANHAFNQTDGPIYSAEGIDRTVISTGDNFAIRQLFDMLGIDVQRHYRQSVGQESGGRGR